MSPVTSDVYAMCIQREGYAKCLVEQPEGTALGLGRKLIEALTMAKGLPVVVTLVDKLEEEDE